MSRGIRAVGLLVALALTISSCGLSTDDEPQDLSADNVPFGLLDPREPTTTSSPTTVPAATRTLPVYLLDPDERLVAVERQISVPATVGKTIRALLEGATDDETDDGLRSAIPSAVELLGVQRREDGRTVVLDFSADPGFPQGAEGISAIAQVVFTATELEGVSGVTFAFDGVPTDVPRGEGDITSDPLYRRDFPNRDPANTTTTSTNESPPEE